MKISVVIPTYNRKKFLKEAIDSVLSQSYQPIELIVVDDGSTDKTSEILSQYQNKIQVIKQENKGVSAARNAGIKQGSGEWCAFLDSDDQWKPQKIEKQVKWLQAHPQVRVCHTDEIWVRNGTRVNPMKKHAKPSGWIFEQCLPFCVVSPSAVLIHRSVFKKIGLFDETLPACEDYDLWIRIAAQFPFGFVPEKLLYKRGGHEDQLSKKHWGLDRFRVQSLLKLIKSNTFKLEQILLVKKVLKEKCRILANGAEKRGKSQEANQYLEIIKQFEV